jgi:ABC-type glycerol-3-phosphate transport system permease component
LQTFIYIWVTFCVLFTLFPVFITLINATKSDLEIKTSIFAFANVGTFGQSLSHNFSLAWDAVREPFWRSIFISLLGAIVDCAMGAILAYVFVYKDFYFKEGIFMIFIAVLLLPSIMGMPILVPFVQNTLNLGDTYIGYLLPNWAGGQVAALFLLRTFFGQQPKSLYESAQVEGANDFQIFFRITIPLALPIILYHFIGTFAALYNDYLWASLIFSSKMTLMPTIHSMSTYFTGQSETGAMYAMYVISSIPLIITTALSMHFFKSGDFAAGLKL